MIDIVKHILSNDSAVAAIVPDARITASERVQGDAMPAIMIDLVSTDDGYVLGGLEGTSDYTFDIIGYTASFAQANSLMTALKGAVADYTGAFTTAAGNDYTVVASNIVNREVEKDSGLDAYETTVTVTVIINDIAS